MTHIITKSNVSIKGGDLPDNFGVKIKSVTIDFEGAKVEDLYEDAAASMIITWQRRARKMAPAQLKKFAETGVVNLKWSEVKAGTKSVTDLRATLKALGYDDKTVDLIMNNRELVDKMFAELNK